jgi:hypothetical protein
MVLMVRGPYWMHAFWEVSPRSIERAQSALGQEWHGARPVLRVLRIESGLQGSPSEQVIREIENRYNVRVEVVSAELKNKQITGILPNDNLQILLQALSVAMDCSITQEKQTIFIKSAIN